MTAKRFKIFEHSGDDYLLDMEYALGYDDPNVDYIEFLGQAMTTKECCKELNHLHEEKEQLKVILSNYMKQIDKLCIKKGLLEQQLSLIDKLIDDLGSEEMHRQYKIIIGWKE